MESNQPNTSITTTQKHGQTTWKPNTHNNKAQRPEDSVLPCKYLRPPDWKRTPNDYDFEDDDETTNTIAIRPTWG